MRTAILQSIGIGAAVALSSRVAESLSRRFMPNAAELAQNLIGMGIAGITAGLLFFLWRYQHRERLRLLQERERVVRHVHHHIRNSLQVIINRYPEDALISKHVSHILKELNYALPGGGRAMPAGPESLGSASARDHVQQDQGAK